VRDRLHEAVGLLMTLHGEALARVLALAADPALGGPALLTRLADDDVVGPVLIAHDLHPHVPPTRVARTLERLRPRIAASGCRAALESAEGGVARIRVAGRSRLSAESSAALTEWLTTTLRDIAPELSTVVIENDAAERPVREEVPLPLIQITRSAPAR
jgi:hypothetical protein